MKRAEYLEGAFEAYNEGRIDADTYDTMLMNADEFCEEECKMDRGQLIVVNGQICEYDRYDKYLDIHYATEIEVDEYGHMTVTYAPICFDSKEFADGYNKADFTEEQWYGIVECLIRQKYDLSNEDIDDATEDIVGRCFVLNMPRFDELEDYIDRYMDR